MANSIVYSQRMQVIVKIVFPYFHPDTVMIDGFFTNWEDSLMTKLNDGTYQYDAGSLTSGHDYIFNAGFKLFPYNHLNYFYISTGYLNLSRIMYARVYLNDQLINSTYVWGDNNMHFRINNDGSIHAANNPVNQNIDDRIPPEVHWPFADIHDSTDFPDSKQTQVSGWVQVLNDNNYTEQSKIEVDYIKLYARTETKDILLDSTEYFSFDQANDGGLYMRYPFFPIGYDDSHDSMPAIVTNGYLIFNPSSERNKVWHFWNPKYPRARTNPNYTSYWFEIKYRITGKACIQVGIDFRDINNITKEGAVSNWNFESYDGLFHTLIVDTKHPILTSININRMLIPKEFHLFHNYPNPFNPSTKIVFQIPQSEFVNLTVYNSVGKRVATLVKSKLNGGSHTVDFNAVNLPSGIYIYKMQAGKFTDVRKMILLK